MRFRARRWGVVGEGTEGGGRERCGKRVRRRVVRRGGRAVGRRRGARRWERNLGGGWLVSFGERWGRWCE